MILRLITGDDAPSFHHSCDGTGFLRTQPVTRRKDFYFQPAVVAAAFARLPKNRGVSDPA